MYEGNKFFIGGHMETVVSTVCIDGYKFAHSRGIRAVSIVQFYEEGGRSSEVLITELGAFCSPSVVRKYF